MVSNPIIRIKLNITSYITVKDKYRNFGKLNPSSFALTEQERKRDIEIKEGLQCVQTEGHVLLLEYLLTTFSATQLILVPLSD